MRFHDRWLAFTAMLGLLSLAPAAAVEPATYGVDFVSAAASGYAMNEQGMIAGLLATLPPGCTPFTCAPVYKSVVWSGDTVIPLPLLPGFSTVTAVSINAGGWVAGYAGDQSVYSSHAGGATRTGTVYTMV